MTDVTGAVNEAVWKGSLPLEICLSPTDCRSYNDARSYLCQPKRLSYLGLLIPRLHRFFARYRIDPDVSESEAWLEYEGIPLKWHYPLGLLYDIYSGTEPAHPPEDVAVPSDLPPTKWKLTLHYSDFPSEQLIRLDPEMKHIHDNFINAVKEADFLRNGTGKTVMSMSKEDSTQLWDAVVAHDLKLFTPINTKLLNPTGVNLRNIPMRLYLPHTDAETGIASVRVVQALVSPTAAGKQGQTIGTALRGIIPTVFPSTRSPLMAQAVLHGSVLPLGQGVEELLRCAAYLDGWLHIAIWPIPFE